MTAALPVAHGTAEQLARIAHFRALETVQPEELDAVALFLIGDVGDATEKLALWHELRGDAEKLWYLVASDWDDRDLDELTDADWMRHSFATVDQELAHRYGVTRDRLVGEIEGCIWRHRYAAAELRRVVRRLGATA
jgi:hypothetical protein